VAAQVQGAVAVRERGEADARKRLRPPRRMHDRERATPRRRTAAVKSVFMQSGREALLSGDDDNAAVLLAAA